MSVVIAVRFPLGRYHATPWDRSVNEGAVEWPPSPWRLLRTLVATWYTRRPELPAPVLDDLLDALGDPPAYRTPEVMPGHTRHYMPDPKHMKGEPGNTDLTLDPYRWVRRDEVLLIRWDVDLSGEQREVLAKLVDLMPYLGRADSMCEARLLDHDEVPDESWWRPIHAGTEIARLLSPVRPVRRALLELGTVAVRKQRRTQPPGTVWVQYGRTATDEPTETRTAPSATGVDAIRFAVLSRAPLKAAHGILLADEVHRLVTRALDGGRPEVLGHGGATTNHQHAHWVPIATRPDSKADIESFLIWVPAGLTPGEIAKILQALSPRRRAISGRRGANGYDVKGLPELRLLLQGAGSALTVAPDLHGPGRRWRSLTPYLPVRHRKRRESVDDYIAKDVETELKYRRLPHAGVRRVHPDDDLSDRWALGYRRYRLSEHLGQARRGLGLELTFADAVPGPLLLGSLSHFGYGIFTPA